MSTKAPKLVTLVTTLQHHLGHQIADFLHPFLEGGGLELGTRVAAWLVQLADDVGDGRHPELLVGVVGGLEGAQQAAVAEQAVHGLLQLGEDPLHHRVGFRVHRRAVQRVAAAPNAQEAGALLECLGPESAYFQQLLTMLEGAVLVAVGDDVLGQGLGEAGNPVEQGDRGGIHIHPTAFTQSSTTASRRRASWLWPTSCWYWPTPHALGVDLDQLGQGILQPAGDGDGAANGDVEIREFLGGELGGGVDRCPRFTDHDFLCLGGRVALEQIAHQAVGFPGCGAVADADELDLVLLAQLAQGLETLVNLALGSNG